MSTQNKPFKLKEISFICSAHITEDIRKVKSAMTNLLPESLRETIEIVDTPIKGHAGNEIHLLEMTISKSRERKAVLEYFALSMEDFDKSDLYEQLESRIDESNCFYFRFNKQEAYNEKLSVDNEDNTIRIMIKFIVYKDEPNQLKDALLEYGIIKK